MSDVQNPAGGAGDESGGADSSKENKNENQEKAPKQVAWSDHKRAVDDMHKYKREAEQARLEKAKAEEERLREQGEWQKLAEQRKARAEQLEQDNTKLKDAFTRTKKFDEIKKAAVELGLRAEALDDLELVDVDGVAIEITTHGRYIVHGAKEFAEELKSKKPHWFKRANPDPVNPGSGSKKPEGLKKISPTDLYQAEQKMKRGLLSKDDYTKLFKQYAAQPKT